MKKIVICPLCKGTIEDRQDCRLKDGIPHHNNCLEYVENEKIGKELDNKITKKVNDLLAYGIDKAFVGQLENDYREGLNSILNSLHTHTLYSVNRPWIVVSENVDEELYGVNSFARVEDLKLAILEWYAEDYFVHSLYHDGIKKEVEVIQEVKIT